MKSFHLPVCAILLVSGLLSAPAARAEEPAAATPAAAEVAAPAKFSMGENEPLFSLNGTSMTVKEFQDAVRNSPPPSLQNRGRGKIELANATPKQVADAIRDFSFYKVAAEKARAEGITLNETVAPRRERELNSIAYSLWMEHHHITDQGEVTAQDVQAYYDENDQSFVVPETIRMRHLFVPTYERHVAEAGESLESIAEKISGDKSKASLILDDVTKKSRSEDVTDKDGKKMPAQALQPGEILMVPMSEAKVAEAKASVEKAAERLKAGEDFEVVARSLSEDPKAGSIRVIRPEADKKPVLPEIREVFDKLKDGDVSDAFRTKHGFQIIKREQYQAHSRPPVSEVETRIKELITQKRRQAAYDVVMADLWNESKLVEINNDNLEKAAEPGKENDVIFKLGEVNYVCSQFVRDFGAKVKPETTLEERRQLLKGVTMIQRELFRADVEKLKLRDSEEYKRLTAPVEDTYLGISWWLKKVDDHPITPDEAVLKAQFEEHKDSFKQAESTEIWQISRKSGAAADATPEVKEQAVSSAKELLMKKLEGVKSAEDFQKLAKEYSEDDFAKEGGARGKVEKNQASAEIFEKGSPNSIYGPIVEGDNVFAFWLGEREPERTKSFEEVKGTLAKNEIEKLKSEYQMTLKEETIAAQKLELFFKAE